MLYADGQRFNSIPETKSVFRARRGRIPVHNRPNPTWIQRIYLIAFLFNFYFVPKKKHYLKVRPDLCATECSMGPKEFLGRIYTDSLVHSKESLDLLIKVIGEVN